MVLNFYKVIFKYMLKIFYYTLYLIHTLCRNLSDAKIQYLHIT